MIKSEIRIPACHCINGLLCPMMIVFATMVQVCAGYIAYHFDGYDPAFTILAGVIGTGILCALLGNGLFSKFLEFL